MNKAHADALCDMSCLLCSLYGGNKLIKCKTNIEGKCKHWQHIDPFKRKLLEIKYRSKNDKQRTP